MKISEYIKDYTLARPTKISEIFQKIIEMKWIEALHLLQMWLYWTFGSDGEFWKSTQLYVWTLVGRRRVWMVVYKFVGLDENITRYSGTYYNVQEVIDHLGSLGVSRKKAEEAYEKLLKEFSNPDEIIFHD